MDPGRDIVAEMSHRIQVDIDYFGGAMPERTAVAWRGYLAAMLEWNLIPVAQNMTSSSRRSQKSKMIPLSRS